MGDREGDAIEAPRTATVKLFGLMRHEVANRRFAFRLPIWLRTVAIDRPKARPRGRVAGVRTPCGFAPMIAVRCDYSGSS